MKDHTLPELGTIDLGSEFSLNLDTFLKHPYEEIGEAAVELPAIIEWTNQQLQWIIEQKGVKICTGNIRLATHSLEPKPTEAQYGQHSYPAGGRKHRSQTNVGSQR